MRVFRYFPAPAHSCDLLCPFMCWSVRSGHNRDTGQSQENLSCLQGLYTGGMAHHTGPYEKCQVLIRRQNSGVRENSRPKLYCNLRKGKTGWGEQLRIDELE